MARTIDADALREWLLKAGWYIKGQDDKGVGSHVIGKIIDHITNMPTVDAIPVDWIKLNIAISALVEDDEAASLLLTLVDAWHKSGWSLFDGVLPAKEAEKYGIKPREDV